MSLVELNRELLKLLLRDKPKQKDVIKQLEVLIQAYGLINLKRWYNTSNNKNSLLHELVEKDMPEVIAHLVVKHKLDINIRRASDGVTPYQLAVESANMEMCEVLKNLGAAVEKTEDVSKWRSDEDKERAMRIVWMDLEMTSIEDPKILECAVIITDKDLNELIRRNWVIHFEQSVLDGLGEWHQNTFADENAGGNGLFAEVLKSKLTREKVEDELLELIQNYCPEKECPLAGSSIHIDKSVLKAEMPKVHDYLHYRIIDVTSFQLITRRWAPWMEAKMKKQLAREGQETVNHRAMDDILWSIAFMKQFQTMLFRQNKNFSDAKNRRNEQPRSNYQRQRSASPSIIHQNIPPTRSNQPGNKSQLHGDERRLRERLEYHQSFPVKSLKLNSDDQRTYDANPHLREVFINKESLDIYKEPFTSQNRLLKLTPTRFSVSSIDSKKVSTTEYWGQRKLLLTEIEFLCNYASGGNSKYLVVYAGAGSGLHIPYLCSLFPDLEFVLFDTNDSHCKATSQLHVETVKFTDREAEHISKLQRDILFICNVRTYTPNGNVDQDMLTDMQNQLVWHKRMKPLASLLNFRPPRVPGTTPYLKGHLIIEPWASHRTTECRLVVEKSSQTTNYDNMSFAAALHHFQDVKRTRFYRHDMDKFDNEGLDHCYDCQTEIFILREYLIRIQELRDDATLLQKVADMSADISKKIEDRRTQSVINGRRKLDVIPKGHRVIL